MLIFVSYTSKLRKPKVVTDSVNKMLNFKKVSQDKIFGADNFINRNAKQFQGAHYFFYAHLSLYLIIVRNMI